MVAKHIIYS